MSSMQVPSDHGDRGDPVLPRGGGRGLARGGKYVRPAPARCPTRVVCGEEEEFRKTNLQNKGLISADRGTKATLMLTILRSYLSRLQRICLLRYLNLSSASAMPYNGMILATPEDAAISTHDNIWKSNISRFSSMDSGLEAFSRNPTHGSFSALTFQSTEFANYVNQRFLSY